MYITKTEENIARTGLKGVITPIHIKDGNEEVVRGLRRKFSGAVINTLDFSPLTALKKPS